MTPFVDPILYAIPFFILTLLLEYFLLRRRFPAKIYNLRDAVTSISMGLGNVIWGLLFAGVIWEVTVWCYTHRLWTIPPTWWMLGLLLLGDDFCYYWFHRWSHEVRIWWAAHVNHHSSEHYNLSTALRQHWTGFIVLAWFPWLPLAFLGFEPRFILLFKSISLLYQYWIHTELIVKFPRWFEAVMNTPSHHRVHHGSNQKYLDCNYGGILIIWDRLFGTFVPETETVIYGLTKNIRTHQILKVAFHEWQALITEVRQAKNFRQAWMAVFGRPH